MRSYRTASILSLTALTLSACAPMKAMYQDDLDLMGKQGIDDAKPALYCFEDKIDYELQTSVNRFEMTGGGGVNAGFNPGGILQLIGLNVSYESGTLNTSMSLYQSFKTRSAIATGVGSKTKSNFAFGINFLAGLVNGGFNFYAKTPIYDLSLGAIKNNISSVMTNLKKYQDPWSTNIVEVLDKDEFLIPVGKNAGLMVGDRLQVMAASYDWVDQPCESDLRMVRLKPDAIATATVQQVTFDNAYLVLDAEPTAPLEMYAHVAIDKLVSTSQKRRTDLGRSVRIGRVSSPALRFATETGVETVDMAPLVYQQLKVLLRDPAYSSAFYLHD